MNALFAEEISEFLVCLPLLFRSLAVLAMKAPLGSQVRESSSL